MFGIISNAFPEKSHPKHNTAVLSTPDIPTPNEFLSTR